MLLNNNMCQFLNINKRKRICFVKCISAYYNAARRRNIVAVSLIFKSDEIQQIIVNMISLSIWNRMLSSRRRRISCEKEKDEEVCGSKMVRMSTIQGRRINQVLPPPFERV